MVFCPQHGRLSGGLLVGWLVVRRNLSTNGRKAYHIRRRRQRNKQGTIIMLIIFVTIPANAFDPIVTLGVDIPYWLARFSAPLMEHWKLWNSADQRSRCSGFDTSINCGFSSSALGLTPGSCSWLSTHEFHGWGSSFPSTLLKISLATRCVASVTRVGVSVSTETHQDLHRPPECTVICFVSSCHPYSVSRY